MLADDADRHAQPAGIDRGAQLQLAEQGIENFPRSRTKCARYGGEDDAHQHALAEQPFRFGGIEVDSNRNGHRSALKVHNHETPTIKHFHAADSQQLTIPKRMSHPPHGGVVPDTNAQLNRHGIGRTGERRDE